MGRAESGVLTASRTGSTVGSFVVSDSPSACELLDEDLGSGTATDSS